MSFDLWASVRMSMPSNWSTFEWLCVSQFFEGNQSHGGVWPSFGSNDDIFQSVVHRFPFDTANLRKWKIPLFISYHLNRRIIHAVKSVHGAQDERKKVVLEEQPLVLMFFCRHDSWHEFLNWFSFRIFHLLCTLPRRFHIGSSVILMKHFGTRDKVQKSIELIVSLNRINTHALTWFIAFARSNYIGAHWFRYRYRCLMEHPDADRSHWVLKQLLTPNVTYSTTRPKTKTYNSNLFIAFHFVWFYFRRKKLY